MAITFGAANSGAATIASVSISLTIASGLGRFLVAQVSALEVGGAGHVTSIAWNTSEALTQQILQRSTTGSANYWTEIWTLVNPSAVSSNVVFTFDGLQTGAVGVMSYQGVSPSAPIRSTAGADGRSVTIASAVGDLVIGSAVDATTQLTVGADQTERWSTSDSISTWGDGSDEAGAASVVHSYTGGAGAAAVAAISVIPAVEEGFMFHYYR